MIHLEHINLVVSDIPRALTFYQAAFPHWSVRGSGKGDWYGAPRNWIHFGDDYNYLAFSDHGRGENRDLKGSQVGLAHLAFVTDNLDRLIDRLSQAGFQPHNEGAEDPHRKNTYYLDPDGFEVEFVEYLSDLPKERNCYREEPSDLKLTN
ncbi:VOC family protein [Parendozoicomonas haliclonae]|uniref:Glyoxalase-like domain protein n=1 Tax=Parendozoicomonas haliclonae TaxID=1960125 RepID=A0A1X7AQI3_9GAMM|nr:VOC family protein [Parendozoicomonas haliclonae]SMA50556.1 Glyoxalase-like domain protein [Parendozoicomonas haliclonae]